MCDEVKIVVKIHRYSIPDMINNINIPWSARKKPSTLLPLSAYEPPGHVRVSEANRALVPSLLSHLVDRGAATRHDSIKRAFTTVTLDAISNYLGIDDYEEAYK